MGRRLLPIAALVILSLTACAAAFDEAEMQPLASAVTKIAAKLDALVFANPEAQGMTEAELRAALQQQDSKLMSILDDYTVRFRVNGENSSVLVCSADGKTTLVEDAGCSARSDRQVWHQADPCDFALDLSSVCAAQ
jgi:hypothetical protein